MKKEPFFTHHLLQWFKKNQRPLPWKGEKNPYFIWLSEIILQQTRVEQGLPYYLKFKKAYPTVHDLANAPEDSVMKNWQGLGYYSRARNLHAAAKYISTELKGKFPDTYEDILQLKGVGPYTAAAIASFGYDLPHAVVDGNVYRVLARYFGIDTPIDSTKGKKMFFTLADQLLEAKQAADYNQAIMDFGATFCTPKSPSCPTCPMKKHCTAFTQKSVNLYPVKSKKIQKRHRFFNYLIINDENCIFVKKRIEKDIWQNLYDFPLIETEQMLEGRDILKEKFLKKLSGGEKVEIISKSAPFRQILTHQKIVATFWEVKFFCGICAENASYIRTARKNISQFAFPKIVNQYNEAFQNNSLILETF